MAMPEAVTNVLRPASLAIILIALDDKVLNAVPSWPSVTSLITPSTVVVIGKPFVLVVVSFPWLRYAAIANPDAIPVTLGCGIDFLIDLLFGLFLRTYALRAVFRTPYFLVEVRRLRLLALKARHPFLKPILAYFLGSPGLGTRRYF